MTPEFELLCRMIGYHGTGLDESMCDTEELIQQMRQSPECFEEERSLLEHTWRTHNRMQAEAFIALFVNAARYLSDVIGGDVPLLAPRELVDASVGLTRDCGAEALLLGKSMQRSIRSQITGEWQQISAAVVAEVERILNGLPTRSVARTSKYLTSDDIAARLGLSEITVARKCRSGEIDADKTTGNQWRTTEARLRKSPYLNRNNGRRRGGSSGELE